MGVSRTRSGPNRSNSPSVSLNTPPAAPTSSPTSTTIGSRSISCAIAAAIAARYVSSAKGQRPPFGAPRRRDCEPSARGFSSATPSLRPPRPASRARRAMVRARRGPRPRPRRRRRGPRHRWRRARPRPRRPRRRVARKAGIGIARLPGGDLLVRSVLAGVGSRVAAVAVGQGLDERRPLAGTGARDRRRRDVVDRLDVVAVDDDRLQAVGARPVRGGPGDRRDRADRRVLHVLVVLAHEDDRGLPDDGHVERLVERSDVRRAVAEEADRDLAALAVLGGPRRAERDRQVGTDDGVRAQDAVLDAGQVHRPALATEEAGATAEQFGEDRGERHAAGDVVVVPAVRAQRVVVVAHRPREPGGDRFLTDPQVGGAPNEALEEEFLRADLEQPAALHRPVQAEAGLAIHARLSTHWRRTARRSGTG